jgi:mRNA-degrading endonuclease RelE of RelBE toxin-antitoxin system
MEHTVSIQWTDTAKAHLKTLSKKVRRGLIGKADELLQCDDPRKRFKPLAGPFQGCYRIPYARYRAVFKVEEEELVRGDVLLHLKIVFIAVGIRKSRDKKDVYKVAEKLVRLVLDDDEAEGIEELDSD